MKDWCDFSSLERKKIWSVKSVQGPELPNCSGQAPWKNVNSTHRKSTGRTLKALFLAKFSLELHNVTIEKTTSYWNWASLTSVSRWIFLFHAGPAVARSPLHYDLPCKISRCNLVDKTAERIDRQESLREPFIIGIIIFFSGGPENLLFQNFASFFPLRRCAWKTYWDAIVTC